MTQPCEPAGLTSRAGVLVCHGESDPTPWKRLLQAEDGVGQGSDPFLLSCQGRNFLGDLLLLEIVLLPSWRPATALGPCDEGP